MNLSKKLIVSFFGLSLVFLGIFLSSNPVAAVSVNKFFSPNINCSGESTHTLNKTIYSPGETITVSATGQLSCSNGGSTTQSSYADTTWFDSGATTSHPIFVNSGLGSTSGSTTFTATAGGGTIYISYQIADGNSGGSWESDNISYSAPGGGTPTVSVWATNLGGSTITSSTYGTTINVHWSSSNNATSCGATQNGTYVPNAPTTTSGVFPWNPLVDTNFSVTCSSGSGTPGTSSTNVKVIPLVTVTPTPASIPSGGTSNVSWTSGGASSCVSANGGGTGTTGNFDVSPNITTTYTVSCSEAPQVTPGSCSGNYTTTSSSCSGTVQGSICSGGGSPWEGDDCSEFMSQSVCPGTVDPWCHHGCTWHTSNSTVSCSGLTQAACFSHSGCTWTPGSSIPGDSGSGSDTVTVTEKTVFSGFPLSVPPMQKNIAIPINTSTELAWTASGFSNNYPATAHCSVYNSDDSIANDSAGNPLTQMALIIPSANLEIQSGDNNFKVKCYEDSSQNTTYTDGPNHLVVTGPATYVELTAGGITPVTATPGTNVNFEATVTNSGTASTVDSFSNIFQTAIGFDNAYVPLGVKTYSGSVPAIEGGGSALFTKSIPLATADVFIRVCADKSSAGSLGTITETNEGNNCSGWIQLAPLPDLIALLPTTTPSVGIQKTIPVTFSSVIKNQGNATTGASFMNFFQIATLDPNGSQAYNHKNNFLSSILFNIAEAGGGVCSNQTIIDLPAVSMPTLNANLTNITTKSYTFENEGMYWIRACADKSSSSNSGNIAELNESNNCSGWKPVVVGAAPIDGECGCTHYNCSAGTSSNHGSSGNFGGSGNYTWDCLGIGQGSTNAYGCSEPMPPTMSGTLIPQHTSCVISKGASSCNINFSWSTLNPVGTSAVAKPPYPGTIVATGNTRNNFPLAVKYDGETFYLYNSQQLLDQKTVTSSCETGSYWKDGICKEQTVLSDLVTGRISPVLVIVGTPVDFSTVVTNQGDGSTVINFPNLFQLADDIDINNNGVNVSDLNSDILTLAGPLTSNSSDKITLYSYAFSTEGTKYMRACADKSSAASSGKITESNEANNCGPWTMITVASASGGSVNGKCSTAIFECITGNSVNQVIGNPTSPSTWDCKGVLLGITDHCTKNYEDCSPGVLNPPVCDVCENGAKNPPICNFECQNGANNPPDCTICDNGATNPPACTFQCDNGAVNYPTCNLCDNGAKNPPICNEDRCLNGALNYPDCNLCQNGATNPPLCNDESHHCDNGAFNYSDCTICANGATNPPECTGGCENGAYNYPFCTTCANGAVNPSRCTVNKSGKCLNGKTNPPVCAKKSPIYIER